MQLLTIAASAMRVTNFRAVSKYISERSDGALPPVTLRANAVEQALSRDLQSYLSIQCDATVYGAAYLPQEVLCNRLEIVDAQAVDA